MERKTEINGVYVSDVLVFYFEEVMEKRFVVIKLSETEPELNPIINEMDRS